MFAIRLGDNAFRHFALEHQGQAGPERWPVFNGQPLDQQRRPDIVGQVGGNGRARRQQRGFVHLHRICVDHLQLAGIGLGNLCQRGQAARVALHRNHLGRAFHQQRPCQPARTGADFVHRLAFNSGGAGDLAGEIEVEKKILSQRFFCRQAVHFNHFPQGR